MASQTFAFVFPMASGHINPSLPVARKLVSLGHQVHYLSNATMREAIEDTGSVFHAEIDNEPELYEGRQADLFGCIESMKKDFGLHEDDDATAMIKMKALQLEMQMPGVIRWLKRIGAEAVLYCPMLNAEAAWAAKVLGLPSISLLTTAGPGSVPRAYAEFCAMFGATEESITEAVLAYQPHHEAVRRLNDTYGLGLDILEGVRPLGKLGCMSHSVTNLVTTSEDLQDPLDGELAEAYRVEGTRFEAVGALLDVAGAHRAGGHKAKAAAKDEEPPKNAHMNDAELLERVRAARAAGRRVVLASMGTVLTGDSNVGWEGRQLGADGQPRGLNGRELCRAAWAGVFDALGAEAADAGALIVVSLGPQDDALGDVVAPPNSICLPMVPQVDLLKAGVDLFLTHGGQNSFTESLASGVPVVVCPGFADQPVNARKAVALGVGLQVPRPDPDAGQEEPAALRYRADVAAVVGQVSADAQFAEAARACAGRLARLGGVPRAAACLLEAAAAKGVDAKSKVDARLEAELSTRKQVVLHVAGA